MTIRTAPSSALEEPPQPRSTLRRTVLVTVLTGALVGGAAYAALLSPLLGVREIAVTGAIGISPDQVRQAASVPSGSPMLRLDVDEVRRRVAAIREVRTATVTRQWPATLTIAVTERVPLAAVAMGARVAVVDRTGVVLDVADIRPYGLPLIQVARFDPADPVVKSALEVLTSLPGSFGSRVREVRAPARDQVTLILGDGRAIVWGGRERAAQKARIVASLADRKASVIDVSSPQVVTVK